MSETNTVDFERYKQKLRSKGQPGISLQDFETATEISQDRLGWFSLCSNFRGIELFLTELFYDNHKVRRGRNMDSAFIMGFTDQHLHEIEESTVAALKKLGRDCLWLDARGKSFIQIAQEAFSTPFKTNYDAYLAFKDLLTTTDKVVIMTGPSMSKKSVFPGVIRDLVKTLDDAHLQGVHPSSDLIFIDYAAYLQEVWPLVGEYLKITSIK